MYSPQARTILAELFSLSRPTPSEPVRMPFSRADMSFSAAGRSALAMRGGKGSLPRELVVDDGEWWNELPYEASASNEAAAFWTSRCSPYSVLAVRAVTARNRQRRPAQHLWSRRD